MGKVRAAITAVNAWVPPDLLTNSDLTKMVDTNEEWIETRTGIKERHILKGEGLGSSDMAVQAILPLLKKRGIGAEEIEMIICATTTPDMQFPATANIIARLPCSRSIPDHKTLLSAAFRHKDRTFQLYSTRIQE